MSAIDGIRVANNHMQASKSDTALRILVTYLGNELKCVSLQDTSAVLPPLDPHVASPHARNCRLYAETFFRDHCTGSRLSLFGVTLLPQINFDGGLKTQ